jgi:hypothetical protein
MLESQGVGKKAKIRLLIKGSRVRIPAGSPTKSISYWHGQLNKAKLGSRIGSTGEAQPCPVAGERVPYKHVAAHQPPNEDSSKALGTRLGARRDPRPSLFINNLSGPND